MDTHRTVYTVINSNDEGYNLLGIFDTEEAAQEACDKYNADGHAWLRDLFKDDSEEEMKNHLDHFDWWDSARVVEHTMNDMRDFI
jgi:hypothetical protein